MSNIENKFNYIAFGLTISSATPFIELHKLSRVPKVIDVKISEKVIRITPQNEKQNDDFYWNASNNYYSMALEGIGKFEVINGSEINYEKTINTDQNVLNLYILGTCLGIICHQRGLLPIHGCAVATNAGCKIFSGPVGIGKSTLAAAFISNGYRVLADDISVISISASQKPIIYPAYPQIKICQDSATKLKIETSTLASIDSENTKYRYPILKNHHNAAMAVSAIYFLEKNIEGYFKISEPVGATKFSLLKVNTYREALINAIQVSGSHFNLCTQLIANIPMYLLTRPAHKFQIDSLIKLLETHFTEK